MGFRTVVVVLPDGSVSQAQLADNSVGQAQLENSAVGTAQIQPKAVDATKIADHTVGKTQLDTNALDNSSSYGPLLATSDTNALVTWPHHLGATPSIALAQVADTTPAVYLTLEALDATNVTFRVYDRATNAPAPSTAVNAYVWAVR